MDRPSLTAELAAAARASHTKEAEAIRGSDDVAIRFLGPFFRFVINNEPVRRIVRDLWTRRMPGAYGFVIARTKAFDAFVEQELVHGAKQLVVLGAGYDSRAYRFRDLLEKNGGRAFEVDAPATSRRKREKVRRAFGELPPHVAYVEVDFDRQTMREPLFAAGYDKTARTVFLWEGVTFYISASAVDDVLGFVRAESGDESGIVFDYLFRSLLDGTSTSYGAKASVDYVRKRGEPFTFAIDEKRVAEFLDERGFRLQDSLDPATLESRYIGELVRKEVFRVGGFYGIATARVVRTTSAP